MQHAQKYVFRLFLSGFRRGNADGRVLPLVVQIDRKDPEKRLIFHNLPFRNKMLAKHVARPALSGCTCYVKKKKTTEKKRKHRFFFCLPHGCKKSLRFIARSKKKKTKTKIQTIEVKNNCFRLY